jgi:hypothetical protein
MRCRDLLLSGATMIALGALTPGFAQSTAAPMDQAAPAQNTQTPDASAATTDSATTQATHHVRHHRHHAQSASNETGAERQATQNLNQQQLTQSTAQSAQPSQMSQNQAASSQGATATADNSAGASTSGDKMAAQNATGSAMPAAADAQSGVALNTVQNPEQKLSAAKVQSSAGTSIGTVQHVSKDTSGTPDKVEVKLDQGLGMGSRSVWIKADQLRYQPDSNALTTDLTPEQLSTM